IYPAGSNIVFLNPELKTQKFLPVSERGDTICALAVSSDRQFLAVAESTRGSAPIINIYELATLRRRKILTGYCDNSAAGAAGNENEEARDFVALSFSADSKYLAAMSGGPDWTLHYFAWEKVGDSQSKSSQLGDSASSSAAAVQQMSINPDDASLLCCTGPRLLKMFEYLDGKFTETDLMTKLADKIFVADFRCHAFLDSAHVFVGTGVGNVHLIRLHSQQPKVMSGSATSTAMPVEYVAVTARGFYVAGMAGYVALFEKTSVGDWKLTRRILLPDGCEKVSAMSVSLGGDWVIISAEGSGGGGTIARAAVTWGEGDDVSFSSVTPLNHTQTITGLSVCPRRPIAVTTSLDRTIKVWNYVTATLEFFKSFAEEALSVALHPSGLYAVVGFSDKLRVMTLLMDDARVTKEISIRGCREVCFSNGGQIFAAANNTSIQLFNTWTAEPLATLKGHNGRVRSLYFTATDAHLVSAGVDGAIYVWNVREGKRESEYIQKSVMWHCAIGNPDGKTVWAVGNDKTLKEVSDSMLIKELECNTTLTQLVLSHTGRMLFAGLSSHYS
ncbi:WD40 repeat-like protein, partial [Gonapodya prolifera JEL478]